MQTKKQSFIKVIATFLCIHYLMCLILLYCTTKHYVVGLCFLLNVNDKTSLGAIRNQYGKNHPSKKGGKDQESIQSSATPDPGYHMGK